MRMEDRQECLALSGMPDQQIPVYITLGRAREAYTGLIDDKPICMFGVGSDWLMSREGHPFCFGTEDVVKHGRIFLYHSRNYHRKWLTMFDILVNYVVLSVRWLKWLGFKMEEAKPMGPFNVPFHRFSMVN